MTSPVVRTTARVSRFLRPDALHMASTVTPSHDAHHVRAHTVVQLAYFSHLYATTPHPVQMLESIANACLAENRVGHASYIFSELTKAPQYGVCPASDDMLHSALRRGVHALGHRHVSSTLFEPQYQRATHPALALATLYDACSDAHIQLPCTALSTLISTLAKHVHGTTLRQLLDIIAGDFLERTPTAHTSSVLAAFVAAYGRAMSPRLGERFLCAYAKRHGATHTLQPLAEKHALHHMDWMHYYVMHDRRIPLDVPLLDAWSSHTDVWNALIRARVMKGDIVGARIWLERFRLVTSESFALILRTTYSCLPPIKSASPYLTLMHSMSTSQGIHHLLAHVSRAERARLERHATSLDAPFKTAAIYDVLDAMRQDGVVPGVALLNFLASFEAGCGRVERGASLVLQALSLERGPAFAFKRTHPQTLDSRPSAPTLGSRLHISSVSVLCILHAAEAQRVASVEKARMHMPGITTAPIRTTALQPLACTPFPSPSMSSSHLNVSTMRGVLAHCMELVESPKRPSSAKRQAASWLAKKGSNLLNDMLRAMLFVNDFPGAWYTIGLYRKWGITPNAYTHLALWQRFSHTHSFTHDLSLPTATIEAMRTTLQHVIEQQMHELIRSEKIETPVWAALCQEQCASAGYAMHQIEWDALQRLM